LPPILPSPHLSLPPPAPHTLSPRPLSVIFHVRTSVSATAYVEFSLLFFNASMLVPYIQINIPKSAKQFNIYQSLPYHNLISMIFLHLEPKVSLLWLRRCLYSTQEVEHLLSDPRWGFSEIVSLRRIPSGKPVHSPQALSRLLHMLDHIIGCGRCP
jgi:hypothetical protein